MMSTKRLSLLLAGVLLATGVVSATDARSDALKAGADGTQMLYGDIPADQIETVASGDRIKAAAASGSMMAIWETLEHGERVECLDCIPAVEPLLFDATPQTREIAAWWLRRRVLGVFGPGQVYQRLITTVAKDASPDKRAYAAEALGEFLAAPGIAAVAKAAVVDKDPKVRAAAARALGRLNDEGSAALSKALRDADSGVKLAALEAAGRVNSFADVPAVVTAMGDASPQVRRRAAERLGSMRAKDAAPALAAFAKNDGDPQVRGAAAHALGLTGDPAVRPTLEDLAKNDPDSLVRDLAAIALRRL